MRWSSGRFWLPRGLAQPISAPCPSFVASSASKPRTPPRRSPPSLPITRCHDLSPRSPRIAQVFGSLLRMTPAAYIDSQADRLVRRLRRLVILPTVNPPGEHYDAITRLLTDELKSVGF